MSLEQIVIQPKKMLVTPLPNYFNKRKAEGFDSFTPEGIEFEVGIIEKVGDDLPVHWEGHIVYFTKDLSPKIQIKGIGTYKEVSDDHKILVRMDQDEHNY